MSAPIARIGGLTEEMRIHLNQCRNAKTYDRWIAKFQREKERLNSDQRAYLMRHLSDVLERKWPAKKRCKGKGGKS